MGRRFHLFGSSEGGIFLGSEQTCAKVPKRSEILGSLSPRSGTLMDLGPCTSFLSWDSGNPGPQNCDMPQDPGNPGPQNCNIHRDSGNPGPQNFDSRKTLFFLVVTIFFQ